MVTSHFAISDVFGHVQKDIRMDFLDYEVRFKKGELILERSPDSTSAKSSKVVFADPVRDLAVIEVSDLPADARAIPLALASPAPGDRVFAASTVWNADDRRIVQSGRVHVVAPVQHEMKRVRMIASDIAFPDDTTGSGLSFAPLNSGSPLVNGNGEIVGVNVRRKGDFAKVSYSIDLREFKDFLLDVDRVVMPRTYDDFLFRAKYRMKTPNRIGVMDGLDAAIKLDPQRPEGLEMRASEHNRRAKYALAIDDATRALKTAPSSTVALEQRAVANENLNEWPKVVADREWISGLNPTDYPNWRKLGFARMMAKDHRGAIDAFSRGIDPGGWMERTMEAYEARGDCYVVLERYGLAKSDYERALQNTASRRFMTPKGPDDARINGKLQSTIANETRGKAWQTALRFLNVQTDAIMPWNPAR